MDVDKVLNRNKEVSESVQIFIIAEAGTDEICRGRRTKLCKNKHVYCGSALHGCRGGRLRSNTVQYHKPYKEILKSCTEIIIGHQWSLTFSKFLTHPIVYIRLMIVKSNKIITNLHWVSVPKVVV